MWLILAFCSAALLGFYDVCKKKALLDNAVLPVLFLNTLICSLIFIPFIVLSLGTSVLDGTAFYVEPNTWAEHKYIILKACIVLSSWVFGYFAMKHLPITIVGPINATRPVMVLVGAMLVFGERLNVWQWIGVLLAVVSFFLLSRSGKKEGVNFSHNRWIFFLVAAAILGAVSGLYDKYLMASPANGGVGLSRMVVQSWYNIYQLCLMGVTMFAIWYPTRKKTTHFKWRWSIILISVFLSIADFVYFYALSLPGAMISIVSMVRRGSVVVSFFCGAMLFKEKNLTSKLVDMLFVILGMLFLYIGSH
ncbi:DMT family transporter [Leyella stercorea]|uniref:DMT family transporter n=1 Tax=Leyella stercorea TaxID=363265 RepID=UPI00266EE232|nr:DMT family transporter [Leyella stercorea]